MYENKKNQQRRWKNKPDIFSKLPVEIIYKIESLIFQLSSLQFNIKYVV